MDLTDRKAGSFHEVSAAIKTLDVGCSYNAISKIKERMHNNLTLVSRLSVAFKLGTVPAINAVSDSQAC